MLSPNIASFGLRTSDRQKMTLSEQNRLKQELYVKQKQIQFSNLLERSNADIESHIKSLNNIFLTTEEPSQLKPSIEDSQLELPPKKDANVTRQSEDQDNFKIFSDPQSREQFYSSSSSSSYSLESDDVRTRFEPIAPNALSLHDYLVQQIQLDGKYARLPLNLKRLCLEIIDSLDPNGYYSSPSQGLDSPLDVSGSPKRREKSSQAHDESTKREKTEFVPNSTEKTNLTLDSSPRPEDNQLESALKIVQSLDPPGVGARNFQESLLLRLKKDAKYRVQLQKLIAEHFDDFIHRRLVHLAKTSGYSQEELAEFYKEFPFYPLPGELYSSSSAPPPVVKPDIIVELSANGRLIIRLDDALEDLTLDPYYQKLLFSKRIDSTTKRYLQTKRIEAQMLIEALKNRGTTLLRVAKAVADFQYKFFLTPLSTPLSLTQQQIADKIGLDASTVSRACNNKWLSTPRGVFSFKYLFPKAVTGEVTSFNISDKIRKLVAEENPSSPLSDEEISRELKKRFSIAISRKTVQEHRDKIGIKNSRMRRKRSLNEN